MSELEEPSPVVGFDKEAPAMEPSLVDLFKQDYDEIAAIKDVYIPIVGYERSGFAIKYGLPESGKVLDKIARKVMSVDKDDYYRNLHIAMDMIINLNQGLYVKPAEVTEYVMLDPDGIGEPISFDDRLAVLLPGGNDLVGAPARKILSVLFGNNDLKIIGHAEKLQRWLADTKANVRMELWQIVATGDSGN